MTGIWVLALIGAGYVAYFACGAIRDVFCGCEVRMAKFGDILLRWDEESDQYGRCRCGRRYVKATRWAESVIEWEQETGLNYEQTRGFKAGSTVKALLGGGL